MSITSINFSIMLSPFASKFASNLYSIVPQEILAKSNIAIAFSGGADSSILLHLANEVLGNQNITAITVDHNLREESSREAEFCKQQCQNLGIKHVTLSWEHEGVKSNIQARARAARYELIANYCKDNKIDILLTGHHRDDFIEDYFLKTDHGGSESSFTINYQFSYYGLMVVRPLFSFSKEDIVNNLSNAGYKWVEDPSNSSDKYERSKIRKHINSLVDDSQEEVRDKLFHQITQLDKLARLEHIEIRKHFLETCNIYEMGYAMVDLERLKELPNNIIYHIIAYLLTIIGGQLELPRYAQVMNIFAKPKSRANLHGCMVEQIEQGLLIYRYINSKAKPITSIKGDLWDNRFKVPIDLPYHIDFAKYIPEELKEDMPKLHKKIFFSLPALYLLETIVAIPHIGYYKYKDIKEINLSFKPAYKSKIYHF